MQQLYGAVFSDGSVIMHVWMDEGVVHFDVQTGDGEAPWASFVCMQKEALRMLRDIEHFIRERMGEEP